ncbi:uncharacterized protein LOC131934560 [Physella acuta]|uniref:uncharacterized protein LOC131934560 n=1 Tax=Physella acuta TaxID=109671 RepID=UPI0027DB6EE8|nr:uncharacterized protein LOC131934560 [Physella acuta]
MDPLNSSSEDEAPEEFSATQVKKQRVSQLKSIKDAERKSKDEEKERRRKRNELFKTQKQKKLLDWSSRKLPKDVLEAVSGFKRKGPKTDKPPSDPRLNEDDTEEINETEDRLSDSGIDDASPKLNSSPDFIPIGNSGKLAVVPVSQVAKIKMTSLEKALEFKQKQLYNQPTIPRESSKKRRARLSKLPADKIKK